MRKLRTLILANRRGKRWYVRLLIVGSVCLSKDHTDLTQRVMPFQRQEQLFAWREYGRRAVRAGY